jgi:hypothetical protein
MNPAQRVVKDIKLSGIIADYAQGDGLPSANPLYNKTTIHQ